MTEQQGTDNYIKCGMCKCKYINDDNHIQCDFGFNRLGARYKTCINCRSRYKDRYLASPGIMSDKLRKYYEPCSICNVSIYKYQVSNHQASPICAAYAERAN